MNAVNSEETEVAVQDIQEAYYDHKLLVTRKYVRMLLFVAAVMNSLLLIPDLVLIEGEVRRIIITIVRVFYTIVLLGVGFKINGIKKFQPFAVTMTVCELVAVGIYLFVLVQYGQPNFMIQAMGIITLIIVNFLLPNRWGYMLFVAIFGSAGFFVLSAIFVKPVNFTEFTAAGVYVVIAIILCALYAKNTENLQYGEYMAKRQLEHISSTDYLTATANRFKMEEEAGRWIDFCQRQALPLSLVFIDVDNLKSINDQFGHGTGDIVLARLARLFQEQLRSSDLLARWGGDEFVLLLPNVSLDSAVAIVQKMKKYVGDTAFVRGIHVTCSFGVVEMKEASSFSTLISEADELMYEGKKQGKDNVRYIGSDQAANNEY